jgi:hypothetical protein
MKAPAALGDGQPTDRKLVHESYDLPSSRKEIVQRIEQILNMGGVQKMVLALHKPIAVDRMVLAKDLEEEDAELEAVEEENLVSSIRNAEMENISFDADTPVFDRFLHLFSLLSRKGLKPSYFITNSIAVLKKWVGTDSWSCADLFGIPVVTSEEIPEDVALLVGAEVSDPDTVACSLRFEVEK